MPVLPAVLATIYSSFSFDADVSGTSSLDTCETDSSTSSSVKSLLDVLHSQPGQP